MFRQNKAQELSLGNLPAIVMLLVVAVLAVAFSANIVTSIQNSQTAGTAAYNVTRDGGAALVNLSGQFPNMGIVLGAALIITILVAAFSFRR